MASAALRVTVAGWKACSYFQRARTALQGVAVLSPQAITVDEVEHPDKPSYVSWLAEIKPRFSGNPAAVAHTSSPFIWINESDVRGGAAALAQAGEPR